MVITGGVVHITKLKRGTDWLGRWESADKNGLALMSPREAPIIKDHKVWIRRPQAELPLQHFISLPGLCEKGVMTRLQSQKKGAHWSGSSGCRAKGEIRKLG